MDCRRPLFLLLGLLAGVGGCTYSLPGIRVTSIASGNNKDEIVHQAATYVVYGDFRARLAESKEYSQAQREIMREEAKLSYLKAIEVDSKCLGAYQSLARLLQSGEDPAGAVEIYRKALELSPGDAMMWVELGMCQCRKKDWASALGSMRKALELEPKNRHIATMTGFALARAGQWEDAFTVLSNVNGAAKAHYDLARMLLHLNQADLAKQHAFAALQANPKFEPARQLLRDIDTPRAPAPTPAPIQQAKHTVRADAPLPTVIQASAPQMPVAPTSQASTRSTMSPKIVTAGNGTPPGLMPAVPVIAEMTAAEPVASQPPIVEIGGKNDKQPEQVIPDNLPQATDRPIRVPPLPVIRISRRGT